MSAFGWIAVGIALAGLAAAAALVWYFTTHPLIR